MNKSLSILTCEKILNTGKTRPYSSEDVYKIREWLGILVDLELEAFERAINNKNENKTD